MVTLVINVTLASRDMSRARQPSAIFLFSCNQRDPLPATCHRRPLPGQTLVCRRPRPCVSLPRRTPPLPVRGETPFTEFRRCIPRERARPGLAGFRPHTFMEENTRFHLWGNKAEYVLLYRGTPGCRRPRPCILLPRRTPPLPLRKETHRVCEVCE